VTGSIDDAAIGSDLLQSIFNDAGTRMDGETLRVETSNDATLTLDFDGVPAGEVTLRTESPDTDATARATVTVESGS